MTLWLKIALLVLVGWMLVEKIADAFSAVGYATLIAVGGLFLAYLVFPAVRALNRRLPLWASIALVYAAFAVVALATLWLLVPIIVIDLQQFVEHIPVFEDRLRHLLDRSNLPLDAHATRVLRESIDRFTVTLGSRLRSETIVLGDNLFSALVSFFSLAALAIAVPVTSIYMLLEAKQAKRFLLDAIPHRHQATTDRILTQIDIVLGGFVRGQILVAVTVAAMVTVLLLFLHVPYATLIGVWAGVLDVVPYLGAAAGAVPGVLIALLTNGFGDAALASLGFAAIFELEGNLIAPKIVSHTVGVSPLAVIFAVLIGGEAFGFGGLLVAVPVVGVIRIIIENVRPPARLPLETRSSERAGSAR